VGQVAAQPLGRQCSQAAQQATRSTPAPGPPFTWQSIFLLFLSGFGQAHFPLTQTAPSSQQAALLPLPQTDCPSAQRHWPFWQSMPPEHFDVHFPCLHWAQAESQQTASCGLEGSPQGFVPDGQAHWPLVQTAPCGQSARQTINAALSSLSGAQCSQEPQQRTWFSPDGVNGEAGVLQARPPSALPPFPLPLTTHSHFPLRQTAPSSQQAA
jgi:hypothetical protein